MGVFSPILLRKGFPPIRKICTAVNSLVKVTTDKDTEFSSLTLCNPPVNALNYNFLTTINASLLELKRNGCKGLILTSELPNTFCSGLDLTEIHKPEIQRFSKFWTELQDVWINLKLFPAPTVAAINGHAPAGGCLLAIACDYRIMVNDPKFIIGLNETKVGVIPPPWLMDNMRDVMGNRKAELALTQGTLFTAEQAYRAALIDEVVTSKQDLIERAWQYLDQQSNLPHLARSITKLQYRQNSVKWLTENREEDMKLFYNWIMEPFTVKLIENYINKLKRKEIKTH